MPEITATHWKQILTTVVEDLVEHQGNKVQVVFFWDEVPWMLQEIAKDDKQRRKALLSLPIEERQILEELLKQQAESSQ